MMLMQVSFLLKNIGVAERFTIYQLYIFNTTLLGIWVQICVLWYGYMIIKKKNDCCKVVFHPQKLFFDSFDLFFIIFMWSFTLK